MAKKDHKFIMANQRVNGKRDMSWSGMAERRPLPVQFALYPSRKTNGMLSPCFIVRFANVELIRILDPEHKQPFFSLDGIFLLAGISIPTGLMRFDLRRERGDYDVTLAGLEPREGIWSPFHVAYKISSELGLSQLLKTFFSVKHAWSLDEGESNGIVHNWQPSKDQINPSKYSFNSLSKDAFDSFHLLAGGQQARTPIGIDEREKIKRFGTPSLLFQDISLNHLQHTQILSSSSLEQRLLRWTVMAIEQWLEFQQQVSDAISLESNDVSDSRENSLTHIWSPSTVEMLLFFSELQSSTHDDEPKVACSLNEGQIVLTKSHLQEAHLRQKEHQEAIQHRVLSVVDVNAVLALVDNLWMWYVDRVNMIRIQQVQTSDENATRPSNEKNGARAISERLIRLESSSERMEAALNILLQQRSIRKKEKSTVKTQEPANSKSSENLSSILLFVIVLCFGVTFGNLILHQFYVH